MVLSGNVWCVITNHDSLISSSTKQENPELIFGSPI